MLTSHSQLNVARLTHATRVARSAIASYLRASVLSIEPSPNQPPAATPVNVIDLPAGDTTLIFSSPSMTPIQCSTGSPLRHTKAPAGTSRRVISAVTRRKCSVARLCAHIEAPSISVRASICLRSHANLDDPLSPRRQQDDNGIARVSTKKTASRRENQVSKRRDS